MPEVSPVETSTASKYQPKQIPISDIIELIENKGLNQSQAAKVLGCDHSNISRRLSELDYNPGFLKSFKSNRADVLAYYQSEILKYLTPDKLEKASAYQLTGMFSIMYDKERLELDKSTHNISYLDVVKAKQVMESRLASFESKYHVDPDTIDID